MAASWRVVILICFVIGITKGDYNNNRVDILNDRPIVGILSQEVLYAIEDLYPGMYKSYIAASYVKFVESAGARVVPIWIGKEKEYYYDIVTKVNGVLFPGGTAPFNASGGYADAGEHLLRAAKEVNDAGEYFPIWGTCLGFELLTFLSADRIDHRADCSSYKQALHMDFKPDFKSSKMFGTAPNEVISILSSQPVTSNFHRYCVTEKNLTDFNLDEQWRVMSVNDDVNGLNFISSIESKRYPFYGLQFHPEKNLFEWVTDRNITHTTDAITANKYFADFFIREVRHNHHKYSNKDEEASSLIYNYPATYTGIKGSAYEQCYFFT